MENITTKTGIFYGVGIGPGDPELLTLKAVRCLERCPVIAAPQTHSGEMLALDIASQAVDLSGKEILPLSFTMSHSREAQHTTHLAAAERVRQLLDEGKDVAMLNLGDVSIYSTYAYLMDILKGWGYSTAMIAGVPSFCAIAARLGESLTAIDTPLHIIPANDRTDLETALEWEGTKVLMKSGRQLPAVLHTLSERGLLEQSALVCRCGLEGEEVYPTLTQLSPEQSAGYFASVIVRDTPKSKKS